MLELIRAFVDICLFRRGPQDLPASSFLLYLTLGAYAGSNFLLALGTYTPATAAMASLADTALLAVLTLSLLHLHGRTARVRQTLAALAGTGTVLAVLALPPIYWLTVQATQGELSSVPGYVILALIVWSLAVIGHIIRHALGTRLIVGMVVAMVFYWVAISVQGALFPLPR